MDAAFLVFVLLLAVTVRAYTGFGFSVVYVAALGPIVGHESVVTQAITFEVALSVFMAWDHRRDLGLGRAAMLKVFSVAGGSAAVLVTGSINVETVLAASAALVIVASLAQLRSTDGSSLRLIGLQFAPVAGFASGFMGYWSSMTGPAIVLHYQARFEENRSYQGQLAGYFLILYVWLAITRRELVWEQVEGQAVVAGALILSTVAWYVVVRRKLSVYVPERFLRPAVRRRFGNWILLLSGVVLLLEIATAA